MTTSGERGWKTILGFIILGAGGIMFALASTELAVVDQAGAIGVISFGAALAGVGQRIAQGKQIRSSNEAAAVLARVAGLAITKRKQGGRS